ncbi:MAG: HlyC/CorC family transporter [bacterium]|nr:HlyC/CorC family transporter [bacterium]
MSAPVQLILLSVLVTCSAAVSGSETALFALSRQQLRAFERSTHGFRRLVAQLMRRPRAVLMTVLIANTTVNILFFAVSFFFFKRLSHTSPVTAGIGAVASPFVLVVFSEVLPKAIALTQCQRLAPVSAPLIEMLAVILAPLRHVLDRVIVTPLTRAFAPGRVEDPQVSGAELRALVEVSARQGVINVWESEILQGIVALPSVSVKAVMVPRVDIIAVSLDSERESVKRCIRESGKKKLPVYGRDLDDVRGMIHATDLYIHPDRSIHELLKPAHLAPEQADLLQLVTDFRRTGTQLAIVVDEFGGTAGLVSLEDVMEQIVGDITDADEPSAPPSVQTIDDRTYRLSGDASFRSLADFLGVEPGAERVETLGGYLWARIGRLPRPGDTVRTANLTLTVESVTGRRIQYVRVELTDPDDHPQSTEQSA